MIEIILCTVILLIADVEFQITPRKKSYSWRYIGPIPRLLDKYINKLEKKIEETKKEFERINREVENDEAR